MAVGHKADVGRVELIALLSMIMALSALAIDMMLPAFGEVRAHFGMDEDSTSVARIITAFFLGSASQVLHGPFADRFGRKAVLYGGMSMYALGGVLSVLAPSFVWMLVARFVWGFGAGAQQVAARAMVRDRFEGDRMARVMSFIMAVFVIVPIAAPLLGAAILRVAPWQAVFLFPVAFVGVIAVWSLRLKETLAPEHRMELHLGRIVGAARVVATNRKTVGYTLALTVTFGGFTSYLASSELIIGQIYGRPDLFPFVFASASVVMGLATFSNGATVARWGARRVLRVGLILYTSVSAIMVGMSLASGGVPPFVPFLVVLVAVLASHTSMVPNYNALAMEPMGRTAGMASAIIGTTFTAGGALIGAVIDSRLIGIVTPLAVGFTAGGLVAMALVTWAVRAEG